MLKANRYVPILIVLSVVVAAAQPGQEEKPKFKAIWEPVNYSYDAEFRDVWFVSAEEGWVVGFAPSEAGEGGVILHTTDGGQHWNAQLGDPHSATHTFQSVFFLDAKHGWAHQSGEGALLRTQDGETWESVSQIAGVGFTFATPDLGSYIDGERIFRSQDGGQSWKQVFTCQTNVEVDGLTRSVGCEFASINFPSANVGYATTDELPNHSSAVAKTQDGGITWSIASSIPNCSADQRGLYFTDENTGFVRSGGAKLFATTDGGQTWRGIPQQFPNGPIRFADRQVGWVLRGGTVVYTSDGGKRWSTAPQVRFPTSVFSSSLPAHDRGYVVGSHGMIYRYRIVPIEYSSKGMLPAAAIAAK